VVFVYSDMTARDLLQRRATGDDQETLWQPTPLTIAARTGRLCILDGLQRLPPGAVTALLRLLEGICRHPPRLSRTLCARLTAADTSRWRW
jgi:hypothetical protein